FSELHQLDTFYNTLNINDQDSLNSAAGGNFLDKMPRECLKIIESKSKVLQSRAKAVIAKIGTSSSTLVISSDVAELKDMVKALLLDKKNQGNNFNQNRGGNFNQSGFNQLSNSNQGQLNRPQGNQPPTYQAPVPYAPNVTHTDFVSYIKANDAILRNMQSQSQIVAPVSAPMPNLKPSIPYPSRRENAKRRDQANEQIEKFYEIFKEISFTDALI
nr:hypothetical protein [Tanacetum cinerariifolium]